MTKTPSPHGMTARQPNFPKIDCMLCGATAWTGPKCYECPLAGKQHYAIGIGAFENVDYFCVAETPALSGPSGDIVHRSWQIDVEGLIKKAFMKFKEANTAYLALHGRYTAAIRCNVEKPNKKERDCCQPLFHEEVLSKARPNKPIMIFALGPAVLQSFGFKIGKYADAQGKFHETELNGRKVIIFASLSKRQLPTKTGYMDVVKEHIGIFLNAVFHSRKVKDSEDINPVWSLEKIIKDYVFPKSIKAVNKIINDIILFHLPGRTPEDHAIAIDTETNTLYPHRSKLKILTLIVAWEEGKSVSIPIEHPEAPWTLEDIFPFIQQLLSCGKPKIFHNAKFDLRVLWAKGWEVKRIAWDTMLGEHLLAEDKRGYYGLKSLTRLYLPTHSGYEDELAAARKKAEEKEKKAKKKLALVAAPLTGAAKKLKDDDGFANLSLKVLNEYGAVDADVTRQLCEMQIKRMAAEDVELATTRQRLGRLKVSRDIATPECTIKGPLKQIMYRRLLKTTQVLARMEAHGIAVDLEYADELAVKMDSAIIELSTELVQMVPPGSFSTDFNPNSPAHLRKLFFTTGYYPELDSQELVSYKGIIPEEDLRVTDSGAISTDAAFLKMLKAQYNCKFASVLLEYRAIHKARNTFIENIRVLSKEDGRMHTTFNIMGTATGRLSSSDENMQNIPARIRQHNIKKMFVPSNRETHVIVNADAKAAEVRLYAAYSKDENLIKALCDGMDPHSFFSSVVLNPKTVLEGVSAGDHQRVLATIGIDDKHAWSYEDFQNRGSIKESDPWYGKQLGILRSNIKRVVFGILYGASKNKIAAIVGISQEQAQAIIHSLFRMFPTIPAYIRLTKRQVHQVGIVETFIGRRRRFSTAGMTSFMRAKAERQAVNFKIQSTSSDIVMDVLCSLDPVIRKLGGRQLITVHDSLVMEVPKDKVEQVRDVIYEYGVDRVAQNYPWLPVPFSWDVEVGPSYGELQDVEKYLKQSAPEEPEQDDFEDHEIRNELART